MSQKNPKSTSKNKLHWRVENKLQGIMLINSSMVISIEVRRVGGGKSDDSFNLILVNYAIDMFHR